MLTLHHVYYRYARHLPDVLRDVNYTFARGRFYAIIGESGAGKSTLISLLAGLDSPTAGEVIFDGQDLRRMKSSEYRVRHIGLVFQGYNLLLRQSAFDNVIVPLYLAGLPAAEQKARATALLESVGIAPDKHRRTILQLSGGEQQRVAVARAVANCPSLIIADEPTGNLDERNAAQVVDILRGETQRENRCVIMVTHNRELAAQADACLHLHDGRLWE